jgi:hypothetical protein
VQLSNRKGHVPTHYYCNPLPDLFARFDKDDDGYLDVGDVHAALASQDIDVSMEQAEMFVDLEARQLPHLCLVSEKEFERVVFIMGKVDLAVNGLYLLW